MTEKRQRPHVIFVGELPLLARTSHHEIRETHENKFEKKIFLNKEQEAKNTLPDRKLIPATSNTPLAFVCFAYFVVLPDGKCRLEPRDFGGK